LNCHKIFALIFLKTLFEYLNLLKKCCQQLPQKRLTNEDKTLYVLCITFSWTQYKMAAVPDLTKAELIAEISDAALAAWWTASDALPGTVGLAEFFAKALSAAYVAQTKKNIAAGDLTPLVLGEALAAYDAPTTGTVVTDALTGEQSFTATYSVQTISAADLDTTAPIYA
jgi:hypothetical protein